MTTIKAFVYTEVQIAVPFEEGPWKKLNPTLKQQPGLINKTWLSGLGNNSLGGFYAFDSLENAKKFVVDYFPQEMKEFNVAYTTRIFDASVVYDASKDMGSPYYKN